jgi:hypothetical protein
MIGIYLRPLPDRALLSDGQEDLQARAASTTASATPSRHTLTIVFTALAVSRSIEHQTG